MRDPEIIQATPDMVQMATVLNQQSQLLMQSNTMMSDTKSEQEIDRQNMASHQRTMSDLENNLAEVQEQ
jgi:hypothetical protein